MARQYEKLFFLEKFSLLVYLRIVSKKACNESLLFLQERLSKPVLERFDKIGKNASFACLYEDFSRHARIQPSTWYMVHSSFARLDAQCVK